MPNKDSWNAAGLQQETAEKSCLYTHFLQYRSHMPPEAIIDQFQQLFLTGQGIPDEATKAAVRNLIQQDDSEFIQVLNRCFYILVNHWNQDPRSHGSILSLIGTLRAVSPKRPMSPEGRLLHHKVQQFLESEEYKQACRLEQLYQKPDLDHTQAVSLQTLIPRYPFLFDYLFFANPHQRNHEQGKTILPIQADRQKKYETELSVYYQRWKQGAALPSVINPTLLSTQELATAFQHYVGKVDKQGSLRDSAQYFQAKTVKMRTFAQYKDEICNYLLHPLFQIDKPYTRQHLMPGLQNYVQQLGQDLDGVSPNPEIQTYLCRRLLDFLLIDARQSAPTFNHHYRFIDILSQLGHAFTVSIIMRVTLLLQQAKAQLEKRLAQLFNLYDTHCHNESELGWFIPLFEHAQIAITTNLRASSSFGF
jgi:hypothetical protein